MTHLSSLSFTTLPQRHHNPKLIKRPRMIERLEEQKRLASDASYSPVVKRWKKNTDGTKVLHDHYRRLKPWWRTDINGNVILTVKAGLKALEFEKGKAGILVGTIDRLGRVFDTLIAATTAGELDQFLEVPTAVQCQSVPKVKKVS